MNNTKKQYLIGGIILISISFVLFKFSYISQSLKNVILVLSPLVAGSILAFILNVPMSFLENKVFNFMDKRKALKKLKRPLSLLIVIIIIVAIISLMATRIIPELITIIEKIINKLPSLFNTLDLWLKERNLNLDEIISTSIIPKNLDAKEIQNKLIYAGQFLLHGVARSGSLIGDIFSNVLSSFFTIMFAVYLLLDKEKLAKQSKMILYSRLQEKHADEFIRIANMANKTFSKFLTGQCIEALILGSLIFIFMSIFSMPYAMFISIVVMFMALLPIIGAWIACITGAILILTVNPSLALGFIIMFLVVQTFEGNVIYPRVMGNAIGLPALWILFAVVTGQSFLGFFGALLFIPLVSLIYKLVREYTNKKLIEKQIPEEKIQYHNKND